MDLIQFSLRTFSIKTFSIYVHVRENVYILLSTLDQFSLRENVSNVQNGLICSVMDCYRIFY